MYDDAWFRGQFFDRHAKLARGVVEQHLAHLRTDFDSFFTRRLRAIQWTTDCASKTDCSTATHFEEEALVELRYANGPNPNFQFHSATTQLRVWWSANNRTYTIPVEQIENPTWDYGFSIDLSVTTPPGPGGVYAPGQTLDVAFTLRDGLGEGDRVLRFPNTTLKEGQTVIDGTENAPAVVAEQ